MRSLLARQISLEVWLPVRGLRIAGLALALWAASGAAAAPPADAQGPCSRRGNYVVVDTSARRLYLCSGEVAVSRYPVSLGRGGVGNHAHGANRTPVGAFTLGEPRPSTRGFHTFISFLGAWGLHGPAPDFKWAGRLNTAVDWTQGCVATGSDEAIQEIAAWIKKEKARRIFIGPDGLPPSAARRAAGSREPKRSSPAAGTRTPTSP